MRVKDYLSGGKLSLVRPLTPSPNDNLLTQTSRRRKCSRVLRRTKQVYRELDAFGLKHDRGTLFTDYTTLLGGLEHHILSTVTSVEPQRKKEESLQVFDASVENWWT